jgi:archaellum component FlaG (FlaF/FlaG flagellin family)
MIRFLFKFIICLLLAAGVAGVLAGATRLRSKF